MDNITQFYTKIQFGLYLNQLLFLIFNNKFTILHYLLQIFKHLVILILIILIGK